LTNPREEELWKLLNAFPPAEIPDGGIPAEPFQNNTDFLFGSELAAGKALDILAETSGLFTSGFYCISLQERLKNPRNR
jgi:hypothetical protein